ncbi:hypothetical protein FOPG_19001 [Fusarium oxysporum f. sp. conglutinans race 2 54008]|uniref:Uncharacterized protein n=1 Tax=Fusarium oxysporum f. sp. conglutinans race 2 54008 TaxID=1089457 RepID=X0GXY2_FUSOX|nr:hypothetical protein FOPG_19001 [Fusarium oxysporum f. sp. conglutinans race 2 54008]KAG6996905.1 hypothetical protein FocnCong_v016340 [Fusarium oxysporum f. sp. conglutinans]KAI8412307.1 hypothetical protein FOFC_08937 [Fusarium oxysporum]
MTQQCSQRRPCQAKIDDELSDNRDPYDLYGDHDAFPPQSRGHPRLHSLNLPPPRCHKSERRRPLPDQSRYPKDPYNDPRQFESYQRRHEPGRRRRSGGPDRRRKNLSAPPIDLHVGSRRHKSKSPQPGRAPSLDSETRTGRKPQPNHRSRKADAYEHPRMVEDYNENPRMAGLSSRVPHSRDPYNRGPYGCKSSRNYPDYPGDPHEKKPKLRDLHGDPPPHHRSAAQDSSPEPRQRGRATYYSDLEDENYGDGRRQRARSQERDHGRDRGGRSPSRGRPPTTQRLRADKSRRSSMPASTEAKMNWWQNPYVQSGCRTAFAAGVQAAIKSQDDPTPWLGAKGAKVATAALSAALVDGWIGQKHRGTARQNIMQKGVDFASAQVAAGGISHRSKSRHRR